MLLRGLILALLCAAPHAQSESASGSPSGSPSTSGSPSVTLSLSVSALASPSPSDSLASSASTSTSPSPSASLASSGSPASSPSPSASLDSGSVAPSATSSSSPSLTHSPSVSRCGSVTRSPSASPSACPCATGSLSLSASPSLSGSPTQSRSASGCVSGTLSVSRTASTSPSPSATLCGTVTVSGTASPSDSVSASGCATGTRSPSGSLSPSLSASSTLSSSPSLCLTATISGTASPSDSVSASGCASGTLSPSRSASSTHSPSPSLCLTATITGTLSTSGSQTTSVSETVSKCNTHTRSQTVSTSSTVSQTSSGRATLSGCATASETASGSFSGSACSTVSRSSSVSGSPSVSVSPSVTVSATHSGSPTVSVSGTHTAKWFGYLPPIAILDAVTGENVTFGWLDWRRDYLIVVYAGLKFEFMQTVLDAPPPSAQLFQPPPGVWAPVITDAIEVTPNYLVYSMPFTPANSAPGAVSMTLAAGVLRRSDTTYSRPRQFSIAFGFVPTVSFTNGWSTDSEDGGGGAAWFGGEANATVDLVLTAPSAVLMANTNASQWAAAGKFYVGDTLPEAQRLPGGLPLLAYNFTSNSTLGNALVLSLNVSRLAPGQYPVTITGGVLQDLAPSPASLTGAPTLHGNIRVTGWLKVGPVPSWRVLDASSGQECGGEPLDPERPLALAFEVAGAPEVVAGLAAVAGAGAGAGAAGGARAVPPWGALVDAATAAALPLPPAQLPYSVRTTAGAALTLLYSLAPLAPLAPGNYTPVSAFATGALCNGLPGRALLCTAHETMGGAGGAAATPLLRIGARPAAALYNGAQTNRYGGALNALGTAPASPADAPVPTLASSLALTFSGGGMPYDLDAGEAARACAWGTAVVAPAGLPPPDALSFAGGVLAYTWAAVNATALPSGVYDVMLRAGVLSSASGVPNARAYVRLVVGLALEFWTPDTSIGSGGGDSANGARLAVRSAGAAAAAAAAAGWPAKLTASGAPYVTANTDALLRVRGTPSVLPYEQMLLEVLSYSAPPPGSTGGAAQLVPSPIARSALSLLAAPPLQAYTATADAARVDYLLSLGGLPDGTYLFTLRNDASGASGMASDGTSLAQTVSITDFYGQPMGTRNCSVTLVIVRAPFAAAAYAPGVPGGGAVALNATLPVGVPLPHPGLPLPSGLFVPSPLLPAATIATSISGAELDTRGLALASAPGGLLGSAAEAAAAAAAAAAPLATAALVSSPGAVLGASGTLNLTLTATAETGDVAQAYLLLPLTHRPTATLFAVDSRGRSNSSVLVVKPSAGAGTPALALAFFLELAFDAPVSVPSVRSAAVQCTVQAGQPVAAPCSTLTVGAPEVVVRAPAGGAGALRFRFPLALGAGDLLPIVDAPLLGLELGVDTRGMASAEDARARAHAPPPVVLRLDAHAPKVAKSLIPNDDDPRGLDNVLPARYIPPFLPVVGVPYHATLPYHMYSDAFTAPEAGGVTILGNAQPWVAHYGLVLTPGPLGRAAVEGTAASTLSPPHQSTFFSVIVEDTAGNSYTGANDLQLPILPPHPVAGSPTLRLSSTAPLRAVERGAASLPVFLDPLIDIEPGRAAGGAVTTLAAVSIPLVRVTLTGLETNASFLHAQQEQLEGANPCPESCVLSWGIDVSTGAGELQLAPRLARRDPWAGLDELAAGNLTLAAARNFLRTVRYVNTRVRMGSAETRVLRVQVMGRYYDRPLRPLPDGTGPAVPGYADGVIASAVRTLEVAAVNDAPVIAAPGGALAAGDASGTGACVGGAWGWPPGAPPAPVFPLRALLNASASEWGPPSVTDVDDALLTRAEVALALSGGRGGFAAGVPPGALYGACDPARDALFLPSAYRLAGALPPLLQGVYTPATCSLQLSPLPPALALPIAAFVEALQAVAFTSLDPANPTAWDLSGSAPSRVRALRVTVTDGGSGGLLAPVASAPLVLPVTLTPTPANFTRSLRAIFGARPAGILSSTDLYATRKSYADARGVVYASKWPLVLPGAGDAQGATPGLRTLTSPHSNCTIASPAAVVCTIALDLTPVAGARGRWAGGAIASANAPALPASPAPTVELLVGGSRAGGELVGATAVPLGEAAAGASAGALNHAFAPPSAGVPASSFAYSPTSPSTLTLALARAPPDGALGEYVLQLTIGAGLAQQFAVDLRRAACALSDSPAYVGDAALSGGTAYPDNSLCTYAATAVGAGGGVVTRGGFDASAAALARGEAAMAALGAAPPAIAAALVAARNAARGQARLSIPPGALPPGASLAITAVNLPKALLPLLPPAPPVPTSPTPPAIDAPTALLLGPPGAAFETPFTLCVFVGDLPPTAYGALVFSSQVSARDASKGFTPFALGANGSYSAVTGEVCAQGAHFSIAAVLLLGAPPPVYAPREVRASAMCPSGARSGGSTSAGTPVPGTWTCSGNGACVGAGVCACFAGWTGGDCSLRVCPGGESWGQGSFGRDARAAPAAATTPRHAPQELLLVHGYEECSGRGACDRGSGVCACYSGYEGAACSRMACPRAPAASLAFAHIDHSLGREAAEAEMAWEAVYGEGGAGGEGGGEGSASASASNGTSAASQSEGFSNGVLSRSDTPCSGRGRCLLLRDLPDYAAGAGAGAGAGARARDWAAARVQRCVCDEGWSGPDCSQRTCPYGVNTEAYANAANAPACAADVEAVGGDDGGDSWGGSRPLVATRAVTVLTLTLALPLPPDASGAHYVEAGSDDVVLSVCGSGSGGGGGGGARRTAAVSGVWGGSAAAASALAAALLAAPCMRGAALSVAPPAAPTAATTQAVQYTVTFTALPPGAVAGGAGGARHALPLACAAPVLPGCAGPGCQPLYSQLRAWRAPPSPPHWLGVASASGLRAPPLPPAPPPAAWGVTATLVLAPLRGTPTALFHWEAVSAYGGGALTVGGAEALGSGGYEGEPTPLPPGALRQALAGPFGLRLNISEAEDMQVLADLEAAYGAGGAGGAGWRLVYAWTLPTCSVAVVQRPTEALTPSECSSRGLCSRDTGACACFLGYQGAACERSAETAMV